MNVNPFANLSFDNYMYEYNNFFIFNLVTVVINFLNKLFTHINFSVLSNSCAFLVYYFSSIISSNSRLLGEFLAK